MSIDDIWPLEDPGSPLRTIATDVCVVGAGGTGTAAAVQAAELGLSVVVVEQLDDFGGAFVGVEGMSGFETRFTQADGGVHYSGAYYADEEYGVSNAVSTVLGYHHWLPLYKTLHHDSETGATPNVSEPIRTNRAHLNRLYRTFFGMTAQTIEWLEGHGVSFEGNIAIGTGPKVWHVFSSGESLTPGQRFMQDLGAEARRLGVHTLFKTKGRRILMDSNRVAGLEACDSTGNALQIQAPVVILGTGGFANNQHMLHSVSEQINNELVEPVGCTCRYGDGLKMARAAGASMAEGLGTFMWCGPVTPNTANKLWMTDAYAAITQPVLWLNERGERFCNEALWVDDFYAAGVCLRNQRRAFALFTDRDMDAWEHSGSYDQVFSFGKRGMPLREARRLLENDPSCHRGTSLAELCSTVGLPAHAVLGTVARYDRMCAEAKGLPPNATWADKEYGKRAEHLRPLGGGPYWLIELAAGLFCTIGGIKVNEQAQVLNEAGRAIPGLYAGGCDAGGLYGNSYDVRFSPGSQSAWALVSGRLAAQDAARYLRRSHHT